VSRVPVHETRGPSLNAGGVSAAVAESMPDRLLTDAEVGELLHVPASWVGEAARRGEIPHLMIGRYRRFVWDEVRAWLESQKAGPRAGRSAP
jgi:excisionase family DNA binding protein